MDQKPILVVISAPSGAGKSTICRKLLERNSKLKLSVSATTRPPRYNEVHGKHYYFISKEEFLEKIKNNEFLEYENVFGNYYGSLRSQVLQQLEQGFSVLFDIDVNGALRIKKNYPDAVLIFIKPPSPEELERRLRARKTEDEAVIRKRLERIPEEYRKAEKFDHIVINDDLDKAVEEVEQIIKMHQED